ncbi:MULTISPECIES: PQQ-dependent sugar dehydrogenase [Gordonia]|uniref:PQQ-dependent sugar dehydrogenase n=1 Tax=Gordonia hongkongensis TaxID=1701090 RepID=A0ABT6BUL2_9ACTN|nr:MULTISPECIES: PQQ-dependent sugar dehydrogenase [Gordonia]MCT1353615.1 PQQ-dependent sugar dehydrogenase [Gordonia sp. p3-SID1431]MCX2753265.1 PQQ-dependent sugar dehydrogenase [Gordonia sp. 4N]MDF6101638.1 PQQ-dependent sugar dehydrogenase [Gordonia hongkongensis]OCW84474.1 glucose dehydrogenase [Nocardia farcinica]
MLVTVLTAVVVLVGGCADFSAQDNQREAGAFSPNNRPSGQPEPTPPPETPRETQPPPTGPCVDPDPAVIATCLASTGGVMPGDEQGEVTVVAERTTGKIITTKRYGPARTLGETPVDASGDGGLIDFAYSPTYSQDRLIYAYITTPSDNRIVRLAPGDVPKPILTGIPKGATGNMGAMYFRSPTELVVATGNAGNPAAADDPSSLAGKVLLVTSFTSGDGPRPAILASGFGSSVALCPNASTGTVYVADQTATEDRVQVLEEGGPKVLWTWPDRPQIAGCGVAGGSIFVSTTRTQRIEAINEPTREEPTITAPAVVLDRRYGALGRMAALPNGLLQVATVNKEVGSAKPTDDRVFRFLPSGGGNDRT